MPYRIDVSELTISDNTRTLSKAIAPKLSNIDEDGSQEEMLIGLKLSINSGASKG